MWGRYSDPDDRLAYDDHHLARADLSANFRTILERQRARDLADRAPASNAVCGALKSFGVIPPRVPLLCPDGHWSFAESFWPSPEEAADECGVSHVTGAAPQGSYVLVYP